MHVKTEIYDFLSELGIYIKCKIISNEIAKLSDFGLGSDIASKVYIYEYKCDFPLNLLSCFHLIPVIPMFGVEMENQKSIWEL